MTIQEILEAHEYDPSSLLGSIAGCTCGEWAVDLPFGQSKFEAHRAHVAEVLDKRMREREAEAWELGASTAWQRSSPTVNGTNYYWRSKGEPVNPHSKETFDGRE